MNSHTFKIKSLLIALLITVNIPSTYCIDIVSYVHGYVTGSTEPLTIRQRKTMIGLSTLAVVSASIIYLFVRTHRQKKACNKQFQKLETQLSIFQDEIDALRSMVSTIKEKIDRDYSANQISNDSLNQLNDQIDELCVLINAQEDSVNSFQDTAATNAEQIECLWDNVEYLESAIVNLQNILRNVAVGYTVHVKHQQNSEISLSVEQLASVNE